MINLSAPQDIFLNHLNTKFSAYISGFGGGKTFIGSLKLIIFMLLYPKTKTGYFGASYMSIRDVFFPTFIEAAAMMGCTTNVRLGVKEIDLYRNGFYYGTVICRSMDRPDTIIGFKIAYALVDELDVFNKEKARNAWNKIIARLRLVVEGVMNGVGVTTTPEGFKFVYEKFAVKPTGMYSMVQASTYENETNLPPDYIPSLRETYTDELANAYINGDFVNLTSGTVYNKFDRKRNNSFEHIEEKEPLHIGMDFNVEHMSAKIGVLRYNNGKESLHIVEEADKVFDTPAMITLLKERYPDHNITVYPDRTGKNRKSVNASESDIALLKEAGFRVANPSVISNPLVKDRVLSVNKGYEDLYLFINCLRCPTAAADAEQQVYDGNGEPDKTNGNDHGNDAKGYLVWGLRPIRKPVAAIRIRNFGF